MDSGLALRAPRNGRELLLINVVRIEQPLGINKDKLCPAALGLDLAVEAGPAAGMAGGADLLDTKPDRVLVAIGTDFDDALGLT